MTKKVLILSASPRKHGNSDLLCDEFLKGAQEAGHDVEKIWLSDYKINFCRGCGFCNEAHRCVQNDDMAQILDKMVAADVIVLATPIYFYAMNGQMKTLIDRTVPKYTEMRNKDFYFIMACADDNPDNLNRALEGFRGFTADCLDGAREKGIVYGVGAWQAGEIKGSKAMQDAYHFGKNC